jgi:tripartite-type tricarboxylate transporter receptor subunit TctC
MKKIAVAFTFFFLWVSNVQAQTQFFAGKTIRIIVGLPAGDVYDIYARVLAENMGKHIPGNPSIMVQNMPGASTMTAANYVYNVAKPDGLTFAIFFAGALFRSADRQKRGSVRLGQVYVAGKLRALV